LKQFDDRAHLFEYKDITVAAQRGDLTLLPQTAYHPLMMMFIVA
jgi:hypothetical protein